MSKSERVYDELLSFLGSRIFQIPIRTFMDEKCLIFDSQFKPSDDHKTIWNEYKGLVENLLDGFMKDSKMTFAETIEAVNSLQKNPDLNSIFQVIFEQILISTDFELFWKVMEKHNKFIHEQAVVMLAIALGKLPDSFLPVEVHHLGGGASESKQNRSNRLDPAKSGTDALNDIEAEEQKILQQVIKISEEEFKRHEKNAKLLNEIEMSTESIKQEMKDLSKEREQIQKDFEKMALKKEEPAAVKTTKPETKTGGLPPPRRVTTSSEAADEWIKSAQTDASYTNTAAHTPASESGDGEALRKRQAFLIEQRNKLIALKKQERERQLSREVSTGAAGRERPRSARVARDAMRSGPQTSSAVAAPSADDQQKLEMRRAIAAKLKAEVIGKTR